jgi:hypothetical protein
LAPGHTVRSMRREQTMSRREQLANAWLTHSRVDLAIFVVLPGVHLGLVHLWSVPVLLQGIAADKRPGLYAAAAIVVSLTGTLASVSIAQYLNGKGQRVRLLKQRFPEQLGRTWKGVFLGSIFAAVLFLGAYAADVRYTPATPATAISPGSAAVTGETVGVWSSSTSSSWTMSSLLRPSPSLTSSTTTSSRQCRLGHPGLKQADSWVSEHGTIEKRRQPAPAKFRSCRCRCGASDHAAFQDGRQHMSSLRAGSFAA